MSTRCWRSASARGSWVNVLSSLSVLLVWLAAQAAFACSSASEDDSPRRAEDGGLRVSAGVIDFGKGQAAAEVGIEHRFRTDWCLGFGPHVGAAVTTDGSFFVYAGADRQFELGRSWFIDSSFALGLYEEANGKNIGGPLEFRSGIAVGRRLRNGSRVEFGFFHLSNSAYYRRNPGVNSLFLRWSR